MEQLHWPLAVLSRAIHFKNLSGASTHVGLSQPQLSRLIGQLERELDVILLDRASKRKSAWTPAAFRLADVYTQSTRRLQYAIHEVVETQMPSQIHIGTLEGLSHFGIELVHNLFQISKLQNVQLDIFDQNDLEEKFLNGDLDVCLTSRVPGRQKLKHQFELGYQSIEQISGVSKFLVQSPYEHGREKKKKAEPETNKVFLSNSLALRRMWINNYGGIGALPGSVQKERGKDLLSVTLFAHELFNDSLWKLLLEAARRLKVE
jgi:LysR family transcriptional regulator, transcriptional activator for aaeXAB operon